MNLADYSSVRGFEREYAITKDGKVKSISRKRLNSIGRNFTNRETVMTQFIDRAGYLTVKLTRDRKYGTKYLHRLLALTFIDNPNGYPIVNHIDGNKLNNSLDNLEWVTRSQNAKHAIANKLCKIPSLNRTKVEDICNGRIFASIKEASKAYKIDYYLCKKLVHDKVHNYTCLRLAA